MGSIIGRESVAEPAFKVLLQRTSVETLYEIRQYGKRYVGMESYRWPGVTCYSCLVFIFVPLVERV